MLLKYSVSVQLKSQESFVNTAGVAHLGQHDVSDVLNDGALSSLLHLFTKTRYIEKQTTKKTINIGAEIQHGHLGTVKHK